MDDGDSESVQSMPRDAVPTQQRVLFQGALKTRGANLAVMRDRYCVATMQVDTEAKVYDVVLYAYKSQQQYQQKPQRAIGVYMLKCLADWDGRGKLHRYAHSFIIETTDSKLFHCAAPSARDKTQWLELMATAAKIAATRVQEEPQPTRKERRPASRKQQASNKSIGHKSNGVASPLDDRLLFRTSSGSLSPDAGENKDEPDDWGIFGDADGNGNGNGNSSRYAVTDDPSVLLDQELLRSAATKNGASLESDAFLFEDDGPAFGTVVVSRLSEEDASGEDFVDTQLAAAKAQREKEQERKRIVKKLASNRDLYAEMAAARLDGMRKDARHPVRRMASSHHRHTEWMDDGSDIGIDPSDSTSTLPDYEGAGEDVEYGEEGRPSRQEHSVRFQHSKSLRTFDRSSRSHSNSLRREGSLPDTFGSRTSAHGSESAAGLEMSRLTIDDLSSVSVDRDHGAAEKRKKKKSKKAAAHEAASTSSVGTEEQVANGLDATQTQLDSEEERRRQKQLRKEERRAIREQRRREQEDAAAVEQLAEQHREDMRRLEEEKAKDERRARREHRRSKEKAAMDKKAHQLKKKEAELQAEAERLKQAEEERQEQEEKSDRKKKRRDKYTSPTERIQRRHAEQEAQASLSNALVVVEPVADLTASDVNQPATQASNPAATQTVASPSAPTSGPSGVSTNPIDPAQSSADAPAAAAPTSVPLSMPSMMAASFYPMYSMPPPASFPTASPYMQPYPVLGYPPGPFMQAVPPPSMPYQMPYPVPMSYVASPPVSMMPPGSMPMPFSAPAPMPMPMQMPIQVPTPNDPIAAKHEDAPFIGPQLPTASTEDHAIPAAASPTSAPISNLPDLPDIIEF